MVAACAPPARPRVAPPAIATDPLVAIATWNLHAGRGDLTRFIDDLASGALTGVRPPGFVVLLQEDVEPLESLSLARNKPGAGALAASRGLSFYFVPVRGGASRTSGNAMLSTQPLEMPRALMLPRERQPRAAAQATIQVAGERLFIVNVHMENRVTWWRSLFSDRARGEQAQALLREIPSRSHGILGGDLNTWLGPREAAWQDMARRFPDTPHDPPQPTFHDRLVLDHLFFDLPAGWIVSPRVINNAYGSDHHPVVAVVSGGSRP